MHLSRAAVETILSNENLSARELGARMRLSPRTIEGVRRGYRPRRRGRPAKGAVDLLRRAPLAPAQEVAAAAGCSVATVRRARIRLLRHTPL